MSTLHDIYNNEYFPAEPTDEMPPELCDKRRAFLDEIQKTMGEKFLAEHWGGFVEANQFGNFVCFREGFRLGVSLMLEVL